MATEVRVRITADGAGFNRVVGAATAKVQAMGSSMKAALLGAFSAATVGAISREILRFGDEIKTMAQNLDISTDAAQRFTWAARNANIEVGTLAKGMYALDTAMRKAKGGDTKAKDILAQLGITDLDMRKEDALMAMLRGATNRDQTQALLGQIGVKPIVAGKILGAREDVLSGEIPVVSESTINRLDALGDAFDNLKAILLQAIIPLFLQASLVVTEFVNSMLKWVVTQKAGIDAAKEAYKKTTGLDPEKAVDKMKTWSGKWYRTMADVMQDKYGIEGRKAYEETIKGPVKADPNSTIGKIQGALDRLVVELQPKPGDPDFIGPVQPKAGVPFDREPLYGPKKKEAKPLGLGELGSNEFMKIGNLLGVNAQYRIERLNIRMVDLTERIAVASEQTAENTSNDEGGQSYP